MASPLCFEQPVMRASNNAPAMKTAGFSGIADFIVPCTGAFANDPVKHAGNLRESAIPFTSPGARLSQNPRWIS
jgi:hypothetical protein